MLHTFKECIVHDLIKWIDLNLDKKIKIEDISTRSGYSKFYIQRVFKSVTGFTCAEYIRNRKLECASEDLLCSQMPVMDVAMKYGFESQQIFTRIFKRRFHIPPGRFRQEFAQARSLRVDRFINGTGDICSEKK